MTDGRVIDLLEHLYVRGYVMFGEDKYIEKLIKELRGGEKMDKTMDFGEAIREMKKDPTKRFARKGWNGKGMFIYLTKGRDVPVSEWRGEVPSEICEDIMDDDGVVITRHVVRLTDHFDMKAADGTIVCGWLASQTDMLAEDWVEVKG